MADEAARSYKRVAGKIRMLVFPTRSQAHVMNSLIRPSVCQPVNLAGKFAALKDSWMPRVVAELNDYQFKIVRLQGEFIWHAHATTDEAFIVITGELRIELRDRHVALRAGELFVVPRGVEHRTCADREVELMLIEPRGVPNTGSAGGARTAPNDVWA